MLGKVLREALQSVREVDRERPIPARAVLNVGGNNKAIPIPPYYAGWRHDLLDIDPRSKPDVLCDARNLLSLQPAMFDAVYCSHNLEHYYRHDARKVLRGFKHVLKPDGFAEIIVPDLQCVIAHVLDTKMDLGETLYESPAGPIAALDVIYGLGREIEGSGHDFFAHKTGFTRKLLRQALEGAEFAQVFVTERPDAFEIRALAFKSAPTVEQRTMLTLPS